MDDKLKTFLMILEAEVTPKEYRDVYHALREQQDITVTEAVISNTGMDGSVLMGLYQKLYPDCTVMDVSVRDSIDIDTLRRIDRDMQIAAQFMPAQYNQQNRTLTVILSSPLDREYIIEELKKVFGRNIRFKWYLVEAAVMKTLLSDAAEEYDISTELEDYEEEADESFSEYDIDNQEESSQLVAYVNELIKRASRKRASDIHIEPFDNRVEVRFRIDGMLVKDTEIKKAWHSKVINRIKTMANMDVTSSRNIQDGKINTTDMDIRVNSSNTIYGEKIVLRLLDKSAVKLDIDMLGFGECEKRKFLEAIHEPASFILVTGPTGSGKSTSLLAAMQYFADGSNCAITIEDPVEYRIDNVCQSQVDEAAGVTFASALRGSLRQDPDIIMVGEIRDADTAATAVEASNTGHKVLSTLHTNSACLSIIRMMRLGVEPYMLASTLKAVINQRLVRRLCPNCKEEYIIDKSSPFYYIFKEPVKLYRANPKGCTQCSGGYRGRIAVTELLLIDKDIQDILYTDSPSMQKIKETAVKNGFKTIHEDGIEKVRASLTSMEEIHRVLHYREWGEE